MVDNLPDVQGGIVSVEATPVVLISPAGAPYQTPDSVGQDTANASLASIDAKITALQALVDGLEALAAAATPAGSALIGKVGIDQTAPGTTDSISVATAQGAGAAIGVTSGVAVVTDVNGTIQQYLRGLISLASFLFQNITTSTTTTVKSGTGVLKSVTINALGTIASSVVIYNNTAGSGVKIGTIDSLTLSGTFTFDTAFTVGLTLVTTGTVAPDITVAYR